MGENGNRFKFVYKNMYLFYYYSQFEVNSIFPKILTSAKNILFSDDCV